MVRTKSRTLLSISGGGWETLPGALAGIVKNGDVAR